MQPPPTYILLLLLLLAFYFLFFFLGYPAKGVTKGEAKGGMEEGGVKVERKKEKVSKHKKNNKN